MPNWVANKIDLSKISKQKFNEISEFMKSKDPDTGEINEFDFNELVPMPKELEIEDSTDTDKGMEVRLSELKKAGRTIKSLRKKYPEIKSIETFKKDYPKIYQLGCRAVSNVDKYGYPTWYRWCNQNWGTKWNSSDVDISFTEQVITFQTPWDAPEPIIKAFAKKLSKVKFKWIYADENCGSNTGFFEYDGKDLTEISPEDSSSAAYALYVECWGPNDCLYQDGKGNWNSYACDSCPHKCC